MATGSEFNGLKWRFNLKRLSHVAKVTLSALAVFLMISDQTIASDFNLPFINAADLGNTYAGWAATANDASTTYSNPAGLVRLCHPQLVIAGVGAAGNTRFTGKAGTPLGLKKGAAPGTAGGFLPLLYYSHPISNRVVVGVGLNGPFGLGTNYKKDTLVRYLATRSRVVVIDFMPSIGVRITNELSFGIGLDIEHASVLLNNMYGPPLSVPDSKASNSLNGFGYGFHAGLLYQFNPCTRLGWSYNSQVMLHTTGYSTVYGPAGDFRAPNQRLRTALPAFSQMSIYHDINPKWTTMASVFYTRWRTITHITLPNTVLPGGETISVTIPFEYHDTVDYAVGLNYHINEKWMLRTGATYYNSPSNNRDRSVADPIGPFTFVAVGAHYQQNACFGYDVGYGHSFFQKTLIHRTNPLTPAFGHSKTYTNLYGAQLTWNM